MTIPAPTQDEYAPFYAGYVARALEHDAARLLESQPGRLRSLCGALDESAALRRYEPGKWTVKEVIGHAADSERIFAYRLLRAARRDPAPLPGFDENEYVRHAGFDSRPLEGLLRAFESARAVTRQVVAEVPEDGWEFRIMASGMPISARAVAHVIAGHAEHHLSILRERYGLSAEA